MFTGIVEAIGEIAALENRGGDLRLRIRSGDLAMGDVELGDSIATNGVCLTVISLPGDGFQADVSLETLEHTTLRKLGVGQRVNLEKALTPTSRLGGHLVSGHVDGVGEVLSRHSDARSERFRLRAPQPLSRYVAQKGSITVDGTSLTVNAVNGVEFELNIVPHTLEKTIMDSYRPGTLVNLEVDIIARYLERLLSAGSSADAPSGERIDLGFLADNGFLKSH